MESITMRLNNIADSYYDFVVAVLTYVNNKKARLGIVEQFLNDNPQALASDVLGFIASQDDFYEDAAYARAEVG